MQQLSHKAAQDLKRNVYANYQTYIDASKEITKLEAEMDRLAKGLDEEQGILGGLDTLLRTGLPPGVEPQLDEGSRIQQIKSLDRGNPLLGGDVLHQGRMTVLEASTQMIRGQVNTKMRNMCHVCVHTHQSHSHTHVSQTRAAIVPLLHSSSLIV